MPNIPALQRLSAHTACLHNAVRRLEYNGIGPEGAKAIADALRVNGSLTKMSLAQNKLEEEGTKALCEALEGNQNLKELDISGDPLMGSSIGGPTGAKHVAKMLGVNGSLTKLDVKYNMIRDEGKEVLQKAVEGRSGFDLQL